MGFAIQAFLRQSPPEGLINFLLLLFVNTQGEVCCRNRADASKAKDPCYTFVSWNTSGLLKELEHDGTDKGSDYLRRGDGDVVNTKNDACRISPRARCVIFSLGNELRLPITGADDTASDGVAFGDFRSNDGKWSPVGDAPWNTNGTHKDRCTHCGLDEECQDHEDGESEVREDPCATKSKRLDLEDV